MNWRRWIPTSSFIIHRSSFSLRRLGHRRLLLGAEEAQELHFDDSWVVAGLDAQDALEDDFLDESFFLALQAEFFRNGAGHDVLHERAVERSSERARKSSADDTRV